MSIVLERLTKRYDGHAVVQDVSLEVGDGELFVLLGPSGSGKSTVLRMVAGLIAQDGGRVQLHGRDVTDLPARRRGVGFVFQHYALFRHLTVSGNVEFGLRIRKLAASERRRTVEQMLELVGLAGLGRRMPHQLSGGQQQRVALARALAIRPEVLLLDEPFGALDAKIRSELRRSLRRVQRELGVTTLFVTHDQDEAFELADRMGVMNFGRLLEAGPPDELYLRPQTEFVATFLGTANLMVGEADPAGLRLGPVRFPLATGSHETARPSRVQILFRPEDVAVKTSENALGHPLLGRAVVEQSAFSGSFERLRLRLPPLPGVRPIAPAVPYGGDVILVEASRSQHQSRRYPLHPGDTAWVGVRRVHALAHPGLSLLLPTDGSEGSAAVVALGGEIARRAHARVVLVGCGAAPAQLEAHLQEAKEHLGSGLASLEVRMVPGPAPDSVAREIEREHPDLVVVAYRSRDDLPLVRRLLGAGEHHLMLVPGPSRVPRRILVCATAGEPGKEDVLFAGRLTRHLGATAVLLSVLPAEATEDSELRERVGRFLEDGRKTLAVLGVPATVKLRAGTAAEEVLAEWEEGDYGLLVVGAPLGLSGLRAPTGVVGRVLGHGIRAPVLVVRSAHVAGRALQAPPPGTLFPEEVLR
jgi:sulfate/thiosulfate transport system ATP-binding protein